MNTGYRLHSELSEDQIEADVAGYLGQITPLWSERFQLKAVDEQLTGSDKLFDRFVPIYLQFKVSQGLRPLKSNLIPTHPFRPLQQIRRFRCTNKINTDPVLYFRLRDMARTANDFQHNILRSLHDPPYQYAQYVAPLTLTIDEYNDLLKASLWNRLFTFDPFFYRPQHLFRETSRPFLGLIPFLRGHISIPPHHDVTTSKHHYSYSKSGGKLAWHSGEKIVGDFRLSTWLGQLLEASYFDRNSTSKQRYFEFIDNFMRSNGHKPLQSESNFPDLPILEFATFLKDMYNIKLLFLGTSTNR